MRIPRVHTWNKKPQEAINLQRDLARKVLLQPLVGKDYSLIAGADVSCTPGSDRVWAAVLLLRLPDFMLVEESYAESSANFPYIPGLLSFREIPLLLRAFRKLRQIPDVVLCDGQGLAHPRFFGLACHLGLWLNVPTIGCAKTRLVGQGSEPGLKFGDMSPLDYQGRIVGAMLRSRSHSKPIYVSPGHLMNSELALELVLRCCLKSRIPEPLRLAHLAVNRYRQKK